MLIKLVGLVGTGAAMNCAGPESAFDRFPIGIDVELGPILISAQEAGGELRTAVIDTLSPITVLDTPTDTVRRDVELVLLGTGPTGPIPRASFSDLRIFDFHPCVDSTPCLIGAQSTTREFTSIVGANALSRGAARFELAQSTMRLFPDIGGTNAAQGRQCRAVFANPFAGGGTLVIGGTETTYSGERIAIGGCLAFDGLTTDKTMQGVDALFVLSTAIGKTLLSESAFARYQRYCADTTMCTMPAELGDYRVFLPSGGVDGKLVRLERLALVGEKSANRGPCAELNANYVMLVDGCNVAPRVPECPCDPDDSDRFCEAAGAIEMPADFEVLVVPDDLPLLQALRNELRPEFAEVDGILGVEVLRNAALDIDIDYPNNRVLAHCADDNACVARPGITGKAMREDISHCPGVIEANVL